MLERGFRLRVLEGLCDVGLVVELGLGLGNWRGGDREPDGGADGGERVCGGDHTEERWRMEGRERVFDGGERKS